jgi:AcrR family transcriptional regulator
MKQQRRERRQNERRRAILDAARHLFIEGGYANVPIRRVAAQLEYSPAALYRYFPTKGDIFNELAEEGFRLLVSRETLPTCPPDASPIERLRHFFWGVFDFARLYPEYFYLIFLDRSAPRLKPDSRGIRAVKEVYPRVRELLDACIASGDLQRGLDVATVYNVMCTAIHGVAAMYVCNRLPEGVDPEAYAHTVVDLAIAGLRMGALDGVSLFGTCGDAASGASRRPRSARSRRTAGTSSRRARR